jgi:hypothetical protein
LLLESGNGSGIRHGGGVVCMTSVLTRLEKGETGKAQCRTKACCTVYKTHFLTTNITVDSNSNSSCPPHINSSPHTIAMSSNPSSSPTIGSDDNQCTYSCSSGLC